MNVSQWIIAHLLEIVGYLLAIILIPRILLERRHPGATIAWLLAIALIPFIGVPLYFLIGGKRIGAYVIWGLPLRILTMAICYQVAVKLPSF